MSLIIERFLQCDNCYTEFGVDDRGRDAKEQREAAKRNDWAYIKGKDYCPECKPQKATKKPGV